jgi:hypothetical protein
MKAAAALELGALGKQSETERSGTAAATESLGPLVALLQRGNADGMANSPFALGKTAADGAQRGVIGAADAIGLLVAMLPHGDADGKAIGAADAIGLLVAMLPRGDADGKANARHALDR